MEVALLDRDGVIVAVNHAWAEFARANDGDPCRTGVGRSYLDICDTVPDEPAAREIAAAIRRAVAGDLPAPLTVTMPCDGPHQPRVVDVLVSSRLGDDGACLGATVAISPSHRSPSHRSPARPPAADPCSVPAAAAGWARGRPGLRELFGRIATTARDVLGAQSASLALHGDPGSAVESGRRPRDAVSRQFPVTGDEGPVAQLCLHFDSRRDADGLDTALAEGIAALAGATIATSLRLGDAETAHRHVTWARRLLEQVLAEAVPGADVLRRRVVDEAATLFDADGAALILAVDERTVQVRAATGSFAAELGRTVPRASHCVDSVLRTGTSVVEVEQPGDPSPGSALWVPLGGDVPANCALGLRRGPGRRPFDRTEVAEAARFAWVAGRALVLDSARAQREAALLRADRDRIAADLHDHVVQQLFAIGQGLDAVAGRMDGSADQPRVDSYVVALDAAIRRIRDSIHRLHSDDSDHSLRQRVIAVLDEEIVALGFAAHADFDGPIDTAVDAGLADDVIAVVREALSNIARHARASSTDLSIRHRDGLLTVEVVDNGTGAATPRPGGHGLGNLRHRAAEHDGQLLLTRPPGGGTRLVWTARTHRLN